MTIKHVVSTERNQMIVFEYIWAKLCQKLKWKPVSASNGSCMILPNPAKSCPAAVVRHGSTSTLRAIMCYHLLSYCQRANLCPAALLATNLALSPPIKTNYNRKLRWKWNIWFCDAMVHEDMKFCVGNCQQVSSGQLAICLLAMSLSSLLARSKNLPNLTTTDIRRQMHHRLLLTLRRFFIVFLQHMMDSTCLYMLLQTRGCPNLCPIAALFWKLLPSLGSLL